MKKKSKRGCKAVVAVVLLLAIFVEITDGKVKATTAQYSYSTIYTRPFVQGYKNPNSQNAITCTVSARPSDMSQIVLLSVYDNGNCEGTPKAKGYFHGAVPGETISVKIPADKTYYFKVSTETKEFWVTGTLKIVH